MPVCRLSIKTLIEFQGYNKEQQQKLTEYIRILFHLLLNDVCDF